jgi:peptidoglycan hydrolase-like protein with peptidoglycan-binding domain
LARRQRALVIVAVVAAVASTGGLIASTRVKSPNQLAAETGPPPATLLTAKVVREKLSATLIMRGAFTGGPQQAFTPTSVARTAYGPGGTNLVVTGTKVHAGGQVTAGAVLLEVSERPIVVLRGAFPAYRDMAPGETGKDITQLRAALTELGYRTTDRAGFFGPSTKAAVSRFYRDRGYQVPLDSAEHAVVAPDPTPVATGPPASPPPPDPIVPMSEVVFLPTLPAQVAVLSAGVGDTVAKPLITFSSGDLTLTGKLNPDNAALAKVGMAVEVASETTGFTSTARIASIEAKPTATTDANSDPSYLPVRITRDTPWPRELNGEDVRITITMASTEAEVLAVPQAAISTSANGRTTVSVVVAGQIARVVEVSVGVSADGMVEVTPTNGGLGPGDEVVTGA